MLQNARVEAPPHEHVITRVSFIKGSRKKREFELNEHLRLCMQYDQLFKTRTQPV